MKNRLNTLTDNITNHTVLEHWFSPIRKILDNIRYSDKVFNTLSMPTFILLGCVRQLQSNSSLREQVQTLFHLDDLADRPPLARSTWSDALASAKRRNIVREAFSQLAILGQDTLPDRLHEMDRLGIRQVYAIDASYQTESTHYGAVYPKAGGSDNQKGHMKMAVYDLRKGIPIAVHTDTRSIGEMRVIKEVPQLSDAMKVKNALFVVDRGFVDARYWEERKKKFNITTITRFKSNMTFTEEEQRTRADLPCNEGVVSDALVKLTASGRVPRKAEPWRRIIFRSGEGEEYAYLTNDFSLEPGEIAFLYHRRWDEEKYFDNFKNDLVGCRAWGKNPVAIEQQTLISCMTYILTRVFLESQFKTLELEQGDTTQLVKHKKKAEHYKTKGGIRLRAHWTKLSKIPVQVWRFFKNCFMLKSSPGLYERQLKPLLVAYL